MLKILATSDIHIGRRPTRINEDVARRHSCANVWRRIVDLALSEQVDLVLLGGDVVDEENKFFEAVGALEGGLKRLLEHGIQVYAVTGNHDFDTLNKVETYLKSENFHVLGSGGRWETREIQVGEKRALRLAGWSFPRQRVSNSAISDFPVLTGDLPTIALCHCDLDVAESPYHPVKASELASISVSAWLVGHIHKPCLIENSAAPHILNPGSPQGMDPGETGKHGPWLIELDGEKVDCRQLTIGGVRYEELTLDFTQVDDFDALRGNLLQALEKAMIDSREDEQLDVLVVRANVSVGQPFTSKDVENVFDEFKDGVELGGTLVVVDDFDVVVKPKIELRELREVESPIGVLADLIMRIEDESQPLSGVEKKLIHSVVEKISQDRSQLRAPSSWRRHVDEPESEARSIISRQSRELLETLLNQTEKNEE